MKSKGSKEVHQDWLKEPDNQVKLVDTTLLGGEENIGGLFSLEERLEIARYLNIIGVSQIEAGAPFKGKYEKDRLKSIVRLGLSSSIMSLNRVSMSDIRDSLECGVDAVCISLSAAEVEPQEHLNSLMDTIKYAKDNQLYVSVKVENASRSHREDLVELAGQAENCGANRLCYCDTEGILTPRTTFSYIENLRQATQLEIEIDTRNDFGLATANALSGVYAGARFVKVAVNGWAEPTGNACLQEVVWGLKNLMKVDGCYNTSLFSELAEYVAAAADRILPPTPLPGAAGVIFPPASSIHRNGFSNPLPDHGSSSPETGNESQLIIGRRSSSAAIRAKFREMGIEIDDLQARKILNQVRQKARGESCCLSDKELISLFSQNIKRR